MRFSLKVLSYAGQVLETVTIQGDRQDVYEAIAEYPGAGSAVVTDERGREESIGKGLAFSKVDDAPRRRPPVAKDKRITYRGARHSAPRSWYGAAVTG